MMTRAKSSRLFGLGIFPQKGGERVYREPSPEDRAAYLAMCLEAGEVGTTAGEEYDFREERTASPIRFHGLMEIVAECLDGPTLWTPDVHEWTAEEPSEYLSAALASEGN